VTHQPRLSGSISRRSLLAIGGAALGATAFGVAGCASKSGAQTIRVAVGTQDSTINCAAGGLMIRELNLLEKYLPRTGKYEHVAYDIQWQNFTSGAPLTNEMVAGKLDIGAMADFPGTFNGAAFQKAGRRSIFLNVLCGSVHGSGNGIVVPTKSTANSLVDLKGKSISVPFASTAHGMLLRAIRDLGWDPNKDVQISMQPPEVAGSALRADTIDAHADFVPFAELFPFRGFARKIFDGSQAKTPTFHGSLVDADYAQKYPEIVVAYQRAAIEATQLLAQEPEKYSQLIADRTGVDAEVVYLFHGPLGLQTRDLTWKPEYRHAVQVAAQTLTLLKHQRIDITPENFIDDRYILRAFAAANLNYPQALKNYDRTPLKADDTVTRAPITSPERVAQIWVAGEPKVRAYATPEGAFRDLAVIEKGGKQVRVVYAQDRNSGIKLLAANAWFVVGPDKTIDAFLLRDQAQTWASGHGGRVADFAGARAAVSA
jgi:NitT/TauT family transport system substrate-binding protein